MLPPVPPSEATERSLRHPARVCGSRARMLRDICRAAGKTRIFWVNSPFSGRISEFPNFKSIDTQMLMSLLHEFQCSSETAIALIGHPTLQSTLLMSMLDLDRKVGMCFQIRLASIGVGFRHLETVRSGPLLHAIFCNIDIERLPK